MKNILYLFIVLPVLAFSQQSIQGTFPTNGNFTYAMLYKSTPNSLEYIERSKMASDGSFKIDLPNSNPSYQEELNNRLSDPDKLNTQAFSLLVINSFRTIQLQKLQLVSLD